MNKNLSRILSFLLVITLVMGMMPATVSAAQGDNQSVSTAPNGSGTTEEPYQIHNAAELKWFADEVNHSKAKSTSALCAVLTSNIDLSETEWTPIGYYSSYSDCVFYGGTFDGGGHTVSGLSIDTDKQYQALIGYTKGAVVKNLTVNGVVKTSAASSSYAAGIVAYGNPVTIENCTNNADISSAAKGYLAGVTAGTTGGSKLINCTNNGNISGCGDYVGGIAGSATGSSSAGITEIRNCFNTGSITNHGTPSSYSYSTGGIAGSISGTSAITMCGNTGNVSSTLKRTGGIVGSLGGSVEKSFNTGSIIGTYGTGGIAGDAADKAASLNACYNIGSVTGKTPISTFKDTNAKGVGGIIGGTASNTYKATLKDCYNAGKIISDTSLEDVLFGGVVGDSSGKNYSGAETKGLISAVNCYYAASSAVQGDGRNAAAEGIADKTESEMKAKGFAAAAGKDYIDNTDGGYPLLGWQNPDTEYTVSFTVSPANAALKVKNNNGKIMAADDGLTYHLKNGTYSYTAIGEECEAVNGSFTIAYSGQAIQVNLKVKTYDFVFTTIPSDAALTVDGQYPLADGRTYQLSKAGNPYTYRAAAFGYEQTAGNIQVTGSPDKDKLTVALKELTKYTVTIPFDKENGGMDSETQIQLASTDYPDAEITMQSDGTFRLPDGSYTYTISSTGYKSVKGSFDVAGKNLTLPQARLEIQTAWDGETITEPARDSDGVYLITCPDEMIWYQQKAALNTSARLMADIRINEEVSAASTQSQYNWAPIGTSSSKAYTGDFDGNGHTLSGLYISAGGNNAGVFGYVGTGGSIHDLTISDSVITAEKGNYIGAAVGDLKGTVSNCHITDTVSVTGKSYVGGVVGELDNSGMVNSCSNAGSVTAKGDAAGGIAGRVYSAASNALTDSANTGSITSERYAGGIAGMLYNNGTIENVYSAGTVTAANSYCGGLVGYFRCGTIRSAYASGSIRAEQCGGAFGFLDWPAGQKTAENIYYLNSLAEDATGNTNNCTIQGTVQACSPDELKIMADALGDAFYENETDKNNGYPLLYWQADKQIVNPDAPIPDPEGWNGKTASKAPLQKDGIYQIATPAELKWFAKAAQTTQDIQGILISDIDLNYQLWTAIGGMDSETAFAGILDGGGHCIKNLYISSKSPAGLFAYNAGEIKNLTIDGMIHGADSVAAIAVYNNGTITNAHSYVHINGGNHIAGITAYNEEYGLVINCRNFGSIKGGQYTAGITSANKGTVTDSGNGGAITAKSSFTAGVAADNNGTVRSCANNGQIISTAAVQYAYTGGVVGRNNANVQNLYNSANVVSLGSSVGGCVAINTSHSSANGLYNAGDVCAAYVETENGEDFRVGGAIGEIVSGVTNAYTLNTLTISTGGTLVSKAELAQMAGDLAAMLPAKSDITGTASLGALQAEDTVSADYKGNAENPVYVWYLFDGYDETALAVADQYTIPANLVGYRLHVKIMDPVLNGLISCSSQPIDGFKGSVKINGCAVIGHTLKAVYSGSETEIFYQWYRGSTKIDGADSDSYTVTEADLGKAITVRITGSKPGYIEKNTDKVKTADQAGIWPITETAEPKTDINDVYLICNEAELKWLASRVNSGNTAVSAKLMDDIAILSKKWYPIGNSRYPYTGLFDGNGKTISNLTVNASADEQGFFGNIGKKGEVKRLSVSGNVNITDENALSTGGIAGYLEGKITACTFSGCVNGIHDVGGIVGQAGLNSVVSQCTNTARITGKENVGGIAGSCSYGSISECVNTAEIGTKQSTHAGGIAGSITNYAVVTACYNTGHIIGQDYMGGIAGAASVCAAPQGCYNIGEIDSGLHAFGVLGDLSGTDYISITKGSYYLTEAAQTATDRTAQGVNSASMKKAAFVSLLNAQSGKDLFVMDLKNNNNGYPLLSWQTGAAGDTGEGKDPEQPDILKVTFSLRIDASTDKQDEYIDWIAAAPCTIPNGASAYDLFKKMMQDYGYTYEAGGNSYVSSVTTPDGITLEELDKGARSGWMYTINDEFPDYMASVKLKDGDEMCFFYTNDYQKTDWRPTDPVVLQVQRLIDAIGTVTLDSADAIKTAREAYDMLNNEQKFSVSNTDVLEEAEKRYQQLLDDATKTDQSAAEAVDKMIDKIGMVTIASREAILSARKAYNALTDTQKQYVTKEEALKQAEAALEKIIAEKAAQYEDIYIATGNTLRKGNIPSVSAIGGEWVVLGLARSQRISKKFAEGYYHNLVKALNEKQSEKLHRNKSTENSRAVIALSALGIDASDVDGYNLLRPLADMDYLKKQGINGVIWALIAFDTMNYEIPEVKGVKNQATREKLIETILSQQTQDGGWQLADGIGETDITAMAIQALAPYVKSNAEVQAAVNKALLFLSKQQRANGGFVSNGKAAAESCAQVIVALTSLGIDPDGDERFIKNGSSVLDALIAFYQEGAFRHTTDGPQDDMATEQAYYALVSYYRFLNNQTTLYDMGDVTANENVPKPEKPDNTHKKPTEPKKEKTDEKKPYQDKKSNAESSVNKNTGTVSPLTGDNTAWAISFLLIITGAAVIIVIMKKKNNVLHN